MTKAEGKPERWICEFHRNKFGTGAMHMTSCVECTAGTRAIAEAYAQSGAGTGADKWCPECHSGIPSVRNTIVREETGGAGRVNLRQTHHVCQHPFHAGAPEPPSQRSNADLVELVTQLFGRLAMHDTKELHDAAFAAKNELLTRLAGSVSGGAPPDEMFESAWRSLPPAYDSEIKDLYRNLYDMGYRDAMAEGTPAPEAPHADCCCCDKCWPSGASPEQRQKEKP